MRLSRGLQSAPRPWLDSRGDRRREHKEVSMSRRLRLHVAGGTYYVVQGDAGRGALFTRPEDHRVFERLLAAALRRTRSVVLAYCWLPESIHCAIRIDTTSVGRVMQAS